MVAVAYLNGASNQLGMLVTEGEAQALSAAGSTCLSENGQLIDTIDVTMLSSICNHFFHLKLIEILSQASEI